MTRARTRPSGLLVCLLFAGCSAADTGPPAAADTAPGSGGVPFAPGDWPAYGRDNGGARFSPLDQINPDNVGSLQVVWRWETREAPIPGPMSPIPGQQVRPGNFEATPVAYNDTLFFTTPYNRVVALDGGTGAALWDFDPRTVEWGQPPNGTGFVHRGVAVWSGSEGRRVFLNTRWRLIALDAATGEPIESFGQGGEIDLTEDHIWPVNRLHYTQTSPPVVFEDLLIVGNGLWDGFVYTFERDTGAPVWPIEDRPGEGKQRVVIATGGPEGGTLVAYGLPD